MSSFNKASRTLRKARRFMVVGLIASVFGNHVIESGFSALTASGMIAVSSLVVLKTVEQIIVFAFPLYARVVGRFSPDKALITVDLLEASVSTLCLVLALIKPGYAAGLLFVYMVFDTFVAPVSDLADEFYGAVLATVDAKAALAFNATLYSALACLGFVVGGPLGSFFASISVEALLLINIFLSLCGAAVRFFARTKFAAKPPLEVDEEEYEVTGAKLPLKRFVRDLFASGPASPLLSLVIRIASAMTGELFLLWVAGASAKRDTDLSAFSGMGLVLAVFGFGATFGPMLGRWVSRAHSTRTTLFASAVLSGVIVLLFAAYEAVVGSPLFLSLTLVFLITTLNRARIVILETYRQTQFRGTRFVRIMSWSYSFGAIGTILGLQIGYWLKLSSNPLPCLVIGGILWIFIGAIVTRQIKDKN
ncbi:MFS transporter [Gleimia hominis]|uniref:MFS transporter n=1 Tax=Gleimia hominis TaxID=595468 RepID=UPI000C800117|nr:MFS transporter [Gleimia hominis]WIK63685.1 MFS transporter [Gleimia hominis]